MTPSTWLPPGCHIALEFNRPPSREGEEPCLIFFASGHQKEHAAIWDLLVARDTGKLPSRVYIEGSAHQVDSWFKERKGSHLASVPKYVEAASWDHPAFSAGADWLVDVVYKQYLSTIGCAPTCLGIEAKNYFLELFKRYSIEGEVVYEKARQAADQRFQEHTKEWRAERQRSLVQAVRKLPKGTKGYFYAGAKHLLTMQKSDGFSEILSRAYTLPLHETLASSNVWSVILLPDTMKSSPFEPISLNAFEANFSKSDQNGLVR